MKLWSNVYVLAGSLALVMLSLAVLPTGALDFSSRFR